MVDAPHRPAPSPAAQDLAEESRVGSSEAARAVNVCLLALSRTARAFTLYDARNQAVGEFLADLHAKLGRALELAGGPLALQVRGFELAWRGEPVYVEKERERSLAFRLYRDGVRQLAFAPGLPWDELVGLVEVLSVRFTGVRQQEDDLVTLLSKAGFRGISFQAVEGLAEEREAGPEPAGGEGPVAAPPADWDLPLPALGPPVAPGYRSLSPAQLAALRAEAGEEALASECVDLLLELLERLADERDPLEADDVEGLLFEARDFLVQEGEFGALLRLVPALERCGAGDLRPESSILARFGGPEALRGIARRLHGGGSLPAELLGYLQAVPGDHLADVLDLLASEADPGLRAAYTELAAALGEARPELLAERLAVARGAQARALLAALAAAAPRLACEAALALDDQGDGELQLARLDVLGASLEQPAAARAVLALLGSADERVRGAAGAVLAAARDPRLFEALARHVQERAGHGLGAEEAEALGAVLAGLAPAAALGLFGEWLQERALLQRVVASPAQRLLQRAALAGLQKLPGDEAERLLREYLARSSGELHQLCLAALVKRRRGQRPPGEGPHAG